MQNFWNWLKTYNTSHHVLAFLAVALPTAFYGYPPFRTLVMAAYNSLPSWVSVLIGTAVFLFGLYKKGKLPVVGIGPEPKTTGIRVMVLAAVMLGMCAAAHAQTAAPTPTTPAPSASLFSASSEATAFHYNGAWSAASHTTESFDLIDWGPKKTNSFALEGHELLAPTPGYNVFLGGGRITPDISSLLKETNVPAGTFGVYVQAAAGVTTSPSTHIAALFGGGVEYRVTSSLTWSSLHASYVRLGNVNAAEISTGLQYFFK